MPLLPPFLQVSRTLTGDGLLLFATRSVRMFAYGFLSVVLVLYLKALGLTEGQIGLLLTMTLLGDTVISLWITTAADRIGRKRMLILGALLMALVGGVFAMTVNLVLLVVVATIGVLSPTDKEVGPFLSIEQAALSQTIPDERRTAVFAWYNLVGSLTAALGALIGGFACQQFLRAGMTGADVYRPLVMAYCLVGLLLATGFAGLSHAAESPRMSNVPHRSSWLGLHRSRGVILRLSALFALDAFGGGFILQSIVAYWFYLRFHLNPATLGSIFFVANLLAAASALGAAGLAKRFGLINTMVFTHLPSNVLLLLVPLMPTSRSPSLYCSCDSPSRRWMYLHASLTQWQWSVRMNDLPHRGSRRLPGPSARPSLQPSPVIAWQIPIWSTCRFSSQGA